MEADTDRDGRISFEEFTKMVENTDVSVSMTLGTRPVGAGIIWPCCHFDRQKQSRAHILTALTDQF